MVQGGMSDSMLLPESANIEDSEALEEKTWGLDRDRVRHLAAGQP